MRLEVREIRRETSATGKVFGQIWGVYDTDTREFVRTGVKGLPSAYGTVYENIYREGAETFKRELEKQAVVARGIVNMLGTAIKSETEAAGGYRMLATKLRDLNYGTKSPGLERIADDAVHHSRELAKIEQEIRKDYGILG